jgi:hypothetical protein
MPTRDAAGVFRCIFRNNRHMFVIVLLDHIAYKSKFRKRNDAIWIDWIIYTSHGTFRDSLVQKSSSRGRDA